MNRPDQILHTLAAHGHEAYYVGGCVRDTLLGRPIHDWDITTSALPEQVMACFDRCVPTGIAHGTVTVLTEDGAAEVTTYRADGAYADGRHPDRVTFVSALTEDLSRRDFTVNAMAMDAAGEIRDPMGGRQDLERKLLRCVGDPVRRFSEDALRMLRAVRFSAQLGFEIEKETLAAVQVCAPLCRRLSAERVRDEVEKTLLSCRPGDLGSMVRLGLLEAYLPREERDLSDLDDLPCQRAVRWAGLCRAYPELDLRALRLDKRTAADVMTVAALEKPADRLGWKRLLSQQGRERGILAGQLFGCKEQVSELLDSGEPLWLCDLALSGTDLPQVKGPALGETLHRLLDHVLAHPEDNEKQKLLTITKR